MLFKSVLRLCMIWSPWLLPHPQYLHDTLPLILWNIAKFIKCCHPDVCCHQTSHWFWQFGFIGPTLQLRFWESTFVNFIRLKMTGGYFEPRSLWPQSPWFCTASCFLGNSTDLSCKDCVHLLTGAQEESQVNRQVVLGRDVWKQLLRVPEGWQCCVQGLAPGSGNSAMETGLQEQDLDATQGCYVVQLPFAPPDPLSTLPLGSWAPGSWPAWTGSKDPLSLFCGCLLPTGSTSRRSEDEVGSVYSPSSLPVRLPWAPCSSQSPVT